MPAAVRGHLWLLRPVQDPRVMPAPRSYKASWRVGQVAQDRVSGLKPTASESSGCSGVSMTRPMSAEAEVVVYGAEYC